MFTNCEGKNLPAASTYPLRKNAFLSFASEHIMIFLRDISANSFSLYAFTGALLQFEAENIRVGFSILG